MNRENSLIFQLDGVPKFSEAFPLALQHVVAMIVGCVTPAIIISTATKIAPADKVLMIQSALVVAGLSTLLQLFGLGAGKFRFGSRLPVIMGISFAYVPSMEAIAKVHGIGAILGAQIVGGVVALIVGLFIKQIQKFFPPLITGTVVFTIGLSLYPTAVNYMAGGKNAKDYGAPIHWVIALITLVTVTILNHFAKGFLKLASILIGIIVGYIVSLCFGMVNFSAIADASWVAIPNPVHFGLQFDLPSCVAMGLLFAINSIQAIGDMTATTSGSMDRLPSEDELRGGILGYGFTNIIGALLGGLPTATFSQNVGIVTTTKVVNRCVLGLAAILILISGFVPKISAILTTIPQAVLGGATISVFASIAMTGMRLINTEEMNYRATSIVGLSVALGMGISQAQEALATFPEWVTIIFGKSPVVVTTVSAIILNIILPKAKKVKQ
jgi:uracil-xanthine permease